MCCVVVSFVVVGYVVVWGSVVCVLCGVWYGVLRCLVWCGVMCGVWFGVVSDMCMCMCVRMYNVYVYVCVYVFVCEYVFVECAV